MVALLIQTVFILLSAVFFFVSGSFFYHAYRYRKYKCPKSYKFLKEWYECK